MTDNEPTIIPPPELVQQCWDEHRNQTQILQDASAAWDEAVALAYRAGWKERGAANEAELQRARDGELEAMLAELSGEAVLVEDYRTGDDVHALTARLLLEKDSVTPIAIVTAVVLLGSLIHIIALKFGALASCLALFFGFGILVSFIVEKVYFDD